MALICRDVCRECIPEQEFFEYGLWMPADKYRPDSDIEESSGDESGSSSPSVDTAGLEKEKKAAEEAKFQAIKGEMTKKFDTVAKGKSSVSAAEAGDVARLLGYAPSLEEIRALRETKGDNLSLADIEAWVKTIGHGDDNVDNLIVFFQYYDTTKSGKLSRTQIKNLLRSYGEPLSDQEIDTILSELGMTGDAIDYKEFVTKLLN
eukprot:Blabericola_migrator_1__1658@NODE_1445_length_4532_cov_230_960806_g958_i0_p3_GENE_NODE_1445_length_4532_cov_230_960806_g958_i0NODE_1445_length_4532_cov_230_960806_g958_i0_p3_ORF_typecomplete_len205_score31_22EFhand_7/PF13499_6/6_7e03EFhand_7/PF13499_6/32EFhand_7/PF13499_6/8_2e10EFhand_11/PF08976_11/2_4e03EFhand_11/PF08976_11/1e07EFhand_8/PF13833_6/1_5e02EFhand_8/PF13833_6/1_5e02EFhand_8/PF13833_6/0_00028EFhand_6/PF13405_6/0_00031EFhand_9/PF14658_6/0_0056DUF5580/PF17743_1/0_034HTH_12/PF08461_10/0